MLGKPVEGRGLYQKKVYEPLGKGQPRGGLRLTQIYYRLLYRLTLALAYGNRPAQGVEYILSLQHIRVDRAHFRSPAGSV